MLNLLVDALSVRIKQLTPKDSVVPVFSGPLKGTKWIAKSGNMVCFLGMYEKSKVNHFVCQIKQGMVVYDIGAHVGYYTLVAAKSNVEGKIFAFEPSKENLKILKEHLALNNVKNVTTIQAAVSDKSGKSQFEDLKDYQCKLSNKGSITVSTVCIDDFVLSRHMPPPDLMKIDAEGSEGLILEGGKSTLIKFHPIIFLATHGEAVHNSCIDFLRKLNYNLVPLNGTNINNCSEIFAK